MSRSLRRTRLAIAASPIVLSLLACSSASTDAPEGESTAQEASALLATSRVVNATTGDFTGLGFPGYASLYNATGLIKVHTAQLVTDPNGKFAAQFFTQHKFAGVVGPNWDTFVGDFDHDGFDDYADHAHDSGAFWIHRNTHVLGNEKLFESGNWMGKSPSGTTATGGEWEVLVGDFTGDGWCDFADHNLRSGAIFVHRNTHDGSFDTANWNPKSPGQPVATTTTTPGSDVLLGDFDGINGVDYAEHDQSSGALVIYLNNNDGTFTASGYTGKTATGPGWEVLIADFTGDHLADFADHVIGSGDLWVHQNVAPGLVPVGKYGHWWFPGGFATTNWGWTKTEAGPGVAILGKDTHGGACGVQGTPPCNGNVCPSGLVLASDGTCQCGDATQPACGGTTCNAGLSVADDGTCASVDTFRIGTGNTDPPNVTQPVTAYSQFRFAPGDEVYVTSGGCVQTGGHGNTWKRYVDPSGDNADRLYHGRIWIPGATMGLETVGSVVNRSPVVVAAPPPGANVGDMYLRLGYDDDDYSDNGYDSPDDGTQAQCKGNGNAWIELRVVHKGASAAAPRSCPSSVPPSMTMDPFWSALDANLLPLNPVWGDQCGKPGTTHSDDGSYEGPLVSVDTACGTGNYFDGDHRKQMSCTSFLPTSDTIDHEGPLCSGNDGINGHLNWGFATYTGTTQWSDVSNMFGSETLGDGDFNIMLMTPNNAGLTDHADTIPRDTWTLPTHTPRALGLEFDGGETIRRSGAALTPFWSTLANGTEDARIGLLDNHPATVVGLLGLDLIHNRKAEIHPVLGFSVQTKSVSRGDAEDAWMVFVRPSGDEGECSQSVLARTHAVAGSDMRFVLPTALASSMDSTSSVFYLNSAAGSSAPSAFRVVPQGSAAALLSVPLPSEGAFVVGEVHFRRH